MEKNEPSEPIDIPEAILAAIQLVQVLAETTAGYYRKLAEAGIPEMDAGVMTREFHTALIVKALNS